MSKKKPRPTPVPYPGLRGIFDAHTHLASHPLDDAALLSRAATAGVDRLVTVGDGLAEARQALDTAREFDRADNDGIARVYAACAIHPVRADQLDAAAKAELEEMAADPLCVAVGETGLDTYWIEHAPDTTATLEQQEEALRWHIDLAVRHDKTLMIHNREADAKLMRVLADAPVPRKVMLHCFSSPLEVAQEAIERGYVLSFAGNVTFKRNEELRQAAAMAPAGQLLLETDAPYMTPEPYRGQRNEPALVGHTWACVAEQRGTTVAHLAEELRVTFDDVFGLA